jgi:protocatechuate 3,4-dioxygenase beta subunit
MNKSTTILFFIVLFSSCANSQQQNNKSSLVGGPCEGCEAIFEYGNKKLSSIDTLPAFYEPGSKLKLTGTIYRQDGKPAKDIILYIYHTNTGGVYPTKGGEKGWAERHGNIRGWIKTGSDGVYTFYSAKPGSYPERSHPAHIHATVLEPDGKYYWLDEYQFEGDPLITKENVRKLPRGGTPNVIALQQEGHMLVAKRDIILGKNIPAY